MSCQIVNTITVVLFAVSGSYHTQFLSTTIFDYYKLILYCLLPRFIIRSCKGLELSALTRGKSERSIMHRAIVLRQLSYYHYLIFIIIMQYNFKTLDPNCKLVINYRTHLSVIDSNILYFAASQGDYTMHWQHLVFLQFVQNVTRQLDILHFRPKNLFVGIIVLKL